MIKALCDRLKQGDPACWQEVSEVPVKKQGKYNANDIAVPNLLGLAVRDVAVALVVDYLLQLAYRAGVFVIYGKPKLPAVAS